MFAVIFAPAMVLRFVNYVLEDIVIPARRVKRNNNQEPGQALFRVSVQGITEPLFLTQEELESMNTTIIQRGIKTREYIKKHGG
jgi:hypothetical protein